MIVSFHPCFTGDTNILFAGREPNLSDLKAIQSADAVILPQICRKSLYDMATANCPHVFPNYDARFKYPEKIGQIQLFEKNGVNFPETESYDAVKNYFEHYGKCITTPSVGFPFVFKFNWGGEGDTVFLIRSLREFRNAIQKAGDYEKSGQKGFLIQKYIPCCQRTLRVVIIGSKIISYWRIHESTESFYANLAKGGIIDIHADPALQEKAVDALKAFCSQTKINLAGFDFLFAGKSLSCIPLFLEINYFFGRRGLGGCEEYYKLLIDEIKKWLGQIGLTAPYQKI